MRALILSLLFSAPAFAQGGEIVSAPVTALGDTKVLALRVVDENRACMTLGPSLLAPADHDAFNGTDKARKLYLLKTYVQMYEDLQAAAFRKTESPDIGKDCAPVASAAPGFVSFAEMAAFLRETKAQIAALDAKIKDLDAKIAGASTASPTPRGSVSGGGFGGARGTISGIQIPTPTPATKAQLTNDRSVLQQERARLQDLLPRPAGGPVQTAAPATTVAPRGGRVIGERATSAGASVTTGPAIIACNGTTVTGINDQACQPKYSEDGRRNKISGAVMLRVTVKEDGMIDRKSIEVLRKLNYGLDEKAVECVATWRFRPAMVNGMPMAMTVQIELNFRLL